MSKYDNVIVLGGTGFLGKNLMKVKPNWTYVGRQGFYQEGVLCDFYPIYSVDYINYREVKELLMNFSPDAVIHLAADVGGITYNKDNQLSIFENNIMLNTNILKACRELEIERVLSCNTVCAWPNGYQNTAYYPMSEDDLFCSKSFTDEHIWEPYHGHKGYAWSKRMLHLQSIMSQELGYNYTTFAPSNLYGTHDHMEKESAHFVAALIHKISKLKKSEPLTLLGNGQSLRQFLFAPDLAKIIPILLDKHNNSTDSIIVAPDENLSIDEMARVALSSLNKDNDIEYTGNHTGQYRKDCSNDKLKELIGDFEFTPFEQGFLKTYNWYRGSQ